MKRRIAVGSVAGSAALLAAAIWLVALDSPGQVSAMERIAKKLQAVTSYSYKLSTENTFVRGGRSEPTHVKRGGTAYWQAPGSLCAAEKIVQVDPPTRAGDGKAEVVVDITEIFPAGKPGILINHKTKTFTRLPVLRPDDIPPFSPVNQLRMVREGQGKIVRDLGPKKIEGKQARGYVMSFRNAAPGSGHDAVEVWVDAETDLPLEFGYTINNDMGPEFFRVTDCRWNIDVDPKLFATTPPEGYTDATPRANSGEP
jgi:outer membrane lipoprotein-sorting protein